MRHFLCLWTCRLMSHVAIIHWDWKIFDISIQKLLRSTLNQTQNRGHFNPPPPKKKVFFFFDYIEHPSQAWGLYQSFRNIALQSKVSWSLTLIQHYLCGLTSLLYETSDLAGFYSFILKAWNRQKWFVGVCVHKPQLTAGMPCLESCGQGI